MVIVLRQPFASLKKLVSFRVASLFHVLDCQHVADITNLDANLREL